jgi:hypothetical protein
MKGGLHFAHTSCSPTAISSSRLKVPEHSAQTFSLPVLGSGVSNLAVGEPRKNALACGRNRKKTARPKSKHGKSESKGPRITLPIMLYQKKNPSRPIPTAEHARSADERENHLKKEECM